MQGQIDEHRLDWFEDLTIAHTDHDETVLTGTIVDQSAVYGLVAKLRDLGPPTVSVDSVESETD